MIEPVRLEDDAIVLLDQRALPREESWIRCTDAPAVVEAIRSMVVRGAPAIGVTGAAGVALAARQAAGRTFDEFRAAVLEAAQALIASRPTAVNLAWGVNRVAGVIGDALTEGGSPADAAQRGWAEAVAIRDADIAANRAIGTNGSVLVPDGARVLTHCNAGALATAGYGTALGVVRAAVEDGKKILVVADETRPILQGARLTAWELVRDGIPTTLITDGMAGALMARGEVDVVVVGADRIARNGDVANKIGTYTVAVLARRHGVPFYVAAPTSTLDPDCPDGSEIPIEEREAAEVTHFGGARVAAEGVTVRNPAFDVTPAELVTAIITEKGIHRPPYGRSLAQALGIDEEMPVPAETGDASPETASDVGDIANGTDDAVDEDGRDDGEHA